MAVFVSASDETLGGSERKIFHHAGFLGPEKDWSEYLAPAWQERVLDGPPAIPYLHMTEIRSSSWREENHLTVLGAEARVDEAFRIIDSLGSLHPVSSRVDADCFRTEASGLQFKKSTGGARPLLPDHICFIGYVFAVLECVNVEHPEAEVVDFIVEHKKGVFDEVKELYLRLPDILTELGSGHVTHLLGNLIPRGKDCAPLQAADVLCWHSQRAEAGTLSSTDASRYATLARRPGYRHLWEPLSVGRLCSSLRNQTLAPSTE